MLADLEQGFYPFGRILDLMCYLHPEDERGTLMARLKQWQKLDFPAAARVGRGGKASYSGSDAVRIAILSAMQKMGVPPSVGARLVLDGSVIITGGAWMFYPSGDGMIGIRSDLPDRVSAYLKRIRVGPRPNPQHKSAA